MAVELPEWIVDISAEWALKLIVYQMYGATPPSGGGGGGITTNGLTDAQLRATPVPVVTTEPTVTRHSILLDSGGTAAQLIPTGAKGYSFTVITGTASDGTASGLPVGFSQGDVNTLAAGFTVTASGGTTFVFWNT